MLPEHRLNRAHDPELATGLDPLANFERPLNTQMAVATTSSPRRNS